MVKVNQFVLPMDFMIVDIPDNNLAGGCNVPLIFGRPFLATGGVIIDVPRGEVILRVNGEHATLNMFKTPLPTVDLFAPLMKSRHSMGESVGNGKMSKVAALWNSETSLIGLRRQAWDIKQALLGGSPVIKVVLINSVV